MKNLESFGVQELNAKEIRETEGGNWFRAVRAVFVAAAALHELICDGSHPAIPAYVSARTPYNR